MRVLGFEVEPVAVFYCPDCGYHAVERDGGGGYVLDEGESSRTGCDCEHEGAAWNEEPEYERTERVIVVMVGDDAWHAVDADALRLIEEEDYCPECGQVGCKAYG